MSSRIEDRVRRALDEEVARYDAALLSRLQRARQRALEEGLRGLSGRRWASQSPGLRWLAAACLLLAMVFVPWPPQSGPAPVPGVDTAASAGTDLDLVLAADDLDVIEDLEFYAWLQQQSRDG
jgi:hypothetical protein